VKTLLSIGDNSAELISRFKREGEIGQRLNHPNIAGVHDISEDAATGTLYMVMDYLEGEDLSRLLKRETKLDIPTTIGIISDLAAALDVAHGEGLVHRDIKPSNVMLVDSGDNEEVRAVLMDFGITKLKDSNTITGTGAIGTIGYMAPEQIIEARNVDFYADIYALGVLTFEMLLGEKPFTGGAAQVMFAHIQQPAPDPRDYDDDLPRHIAKAILKALEKDPADRFSSAGEFAKALSAD
jgi:serine/threonine-protein kinase